MVCKGRQVASRNITQKSAVEKFKVNLQCFWGQVVTVFKGLLEFEGSILTNFKVRNNNNKQKKIITLTSVIFVRCESKNNQGISKNYDKSQQ